MIEKITPEALLLMKEKQEKITMLSVADYYSAELVDQLGITCVLVGDTLGKYVQGDEDALSLTTGDIFYYCRIIRKAVKRSLLVVDLPFTSYELKEQSKAIEAATLLTQKAGADAIKLEGANEYFPVIEKLVKSGCQVMGHLGLKETYLKQMGGYPKTMKDKHKDWDWVMKNAIKLEKLGVFALMLECVPHVLGAEIAKKLKIPVIGKGAGHLVDGQAAVFHEMMGYYDAKPPKYVKRYARLSHVMSGAVQSYVEDIRNLKFPQEEHEF